MYNLRNAPECVRSASELRANILRDCEGGRPVKRERERKGKKW